MIERFSVKNFKCLVDVDVRLEPFNVLIGENDTGKSSFLEALIWFSDVIQDQGNMKKSFDDLCWKKTDFPGAALFEAQGRHSRKPGKKFTQKVSIRCSSLKGPFGVGIEHQGEPAPPVGEHVAKYELSASRLASDSPEKESQESGLETDGFGLPSVLAQVLLSDRERFDLIESQLHELVPQIHRLILATPKRGRKSLSFKLTGTDWEIPAKQMSDGVLLLLGYLTLANMSSWPDVLLVEEPEKGVHPRRLKDIVVLLRKMSEKGANRPPVQVVLTTHSPYLLDFVKRDEVLVFIRNPDHSVQVTPLRNRDDLDEKLGDQDFTLGELWFNEGEEKLVGGAAG